MGRKDPAHARTDVDRYRKQLGKQEFKGRNKRETLAVRSRAQARKSESPLKAGILSLLLLVTVLGLVYLFFSWKFSSYF